MWNNPQQWHNHAQYHHNWVATVIHHKRRGACLGWRPRLLKAGHHGWTALILRKDNVVFENWCKTCLKLFISCKLHNYMRFKKVIILGGFRFVCRATPLNFIIFFSWVFSIKWTIIFFGFRGSPHDDRNTHDVWSLKPPWPWRVLEEETPTLAVWRCRLPQGASQRPGAFWKWMLIFHELIHIMNDS